MTSSTLLYSKGYRDRYPDILIEPHLDHFLFVCLSILDCHWQTPPIARLPPEPVRVLLHPKTNYDVINTPLKNQKAKFEKSISVSCRGGLPMMSSSGSSY